MLFGVFATHSPESCPMNNEVSKETFLKTQRQIRCRDEKNTT